MHIDLAAKVALITGAAEGIGRGCARVLSAAGAHVIVADIQEAIARRTVDELRQSGASVEFLRLDVADENSVAQAAQSIGAAHGALHVLVNNAGFAMFKTLAATEPADWDKLMAVDLRGIYLMSRACLPLLEAGAPAAIINIASVHAQLTVGDMTAYAAAKGAILAMVRSQAQELGPKGIRVNVVSPGFVMTPLLNRWIDSEPDRDATIARVHGFLPLGHMAHEDDIGNLVTFLASDKAACITGANHVIDCGLTTRLMH